MAKMSIRCRGRPAMARQKEKFSLPQAVLSQRNMRLSFIYVTRGFHGGLTNASGQELSPYFLFNYRRLKLYPYAGPPDFMTAA